VLAFLVLTIGGCAALIAFGFRAVTAPVDAANAWLDAVADGRQTEVDRISCDIGVADGTVATLDDVGFNGRQNLNESQIISDVATVSGTIETDAGTLPISFQLFKAGDGEGEKGWCVSSAFVG
jgi:transcription elongation factor Elf1